MRPADIIAAGAVALWALLYAGPVEAWDRQVQQGATLARTNCARCHAVERVGTSPLREAPPFRVFRRATLTP